MERVKKIFFSQNLSLVNIFLIYIFLSVLIPIQGQGQGRGQIDPLRRETVRAGEPTEPSPGGGVGACSGAYDFAIGQVCNESKWSHLNKAAISFSSKLNSGDIKGACESAKSLNFLGGGINTHFMNSCGGALTICISKCTEEIGTLKTVLDAKKAALVAGGADPEIVKIEAQITQAKTNMGTCKSKKTSNRVGGLAQIAQNAIAFESSGKCSEDVTDDGPSLVSTTCQSFPPSLQALCHQNGPQSLCQQHPDLAICRRLQLNNLNDNNNPDPNLVPERERFTSETCLTNPSASGCKGTICNSLSSAPLRDVCNTDGVESLCNNIPNLPQCRSFTNQRGGSVNCGALPSEGLADECRSLGAGDFCQKHSQLTICKNQDGQNKLANLEKGGGSGTGTGGGSGLFGGGSGGGGDNGFGSGSDGLERGSHRSGSGGRVEALDRIRTGGGGGAGGGGGSAGRRRGYNFSPGKFRPPNFKSLFGKKKKEQERSISSVNSSNKITSANGLTNFQKVSRSYKARYPVFFGTKTQQQANKTF